MQVEIFIWCMSQNYNTFDDGFSAAVVGATGSVGMHLIELLIESEKCKVVTIIVRKPILRWAKDKYKDKLIIIILEHFETMEEFGKKLDAYDCYF